MATTTLVPPLPEAPAGSGIVYRRFRGVDEDVPGMGAANQRLRTRIGLVEPIDVEAMQHRYRHLVNSDPVTDCIVVEVDGVIAGYARVEWHNLVDGDRIYDLTAVVEPAHWHLDIGGALVDWGEARSRAVAAGHASDRRSWFATYVFHGDEELRAAVEARGYTPVRWDAEMLRPDLDVLPERAVPAGYTIRHPREDELPAVHEMAVTAFAEHWGEWEADEHSYEEWVDDPRFRRDLVVVAWDADERPAAYVANVVEAAPDGSPRGLLDGVATHPAHRRRGLARACIIESLHRLRAEGCTSAYLGVDTDNHNRALALYESCGFRTVSGSTSYRRPFDRGDAT